ncbi:cytochrome c peroxidase [Variovorax sp. J22R133]|uniref:cytochrome-c peroxidase n=1 Tax=Variovorax brevis TaxID=3053503 RepID=UPI002577A1B1|nr:cytochrome c peroxidase [Variovorax sp. J22R133]MDM0116487.1 cytochrome c peroxidase [Variovorax sp. J22R133]
MRFVLAVLFGLAVGVANSQPGGATKSERDTWSPQELALLRSMKLSRLAPAEPDVSNRYAKDPRAIALGKQLFNDPRFSKNGQVSCASCHQPQHQFQDGRPLGIGVAVGVRRTMPLMGVDRNAWFFWDGRKDSLWSQALGPLEDAREHGGNRMRHVRVLARHHGPAYAKLFGPPPSLAGLPQDAGPLGTDIERAAWAAIDKGRREGVSRMFANMGKAIAAYESTLQYGPSRMDRYVSSLDDPDSRGASALDASEKAGLRLYIGKAQCFVCHGGPLLSDQFFHNIGVPPLKSGLPERGRVEGLTQALADEFNCLGRFSDARPDQCQELRFASTEDALLLGAFKSPSLRNVALRPPYMHTGQFATLEQVLEHYNRPPEATTGRSELKKLKPINLSPAELAQLASFLRALSGPVVEGAPTR